MKPIHLFDEAYEAAMNRAIPQTTEMVDLSDAFGRYLAQNVIAKLNVPPFHRAMMDGYAIRASDTAEDGEKFEIVGSVIAGDESNIPIQTRQAIRIMTGAPVPDGADAIARFEWCDEPENNRVRILKKIRVGESIQYTGEDGHAGQVLMLKGQRLSGAELAVCKTFGIASVEVTTRPRVCILVTGNELVQNPNIPLRRGQIYGANELFIHGALIDDGAIITFTKYVEDNMEKIQNAIREAAKDHDYVIMTGGISAGDLDFVPGAIRQLSNKLDVEKVLMRPGAPFIVSQVGSCSVFALSGNPAASFIQFETLVRPVIRATLGFMDHGFSLTGIILHDIHLKPIKHTRILRAIAKHSQGRIVLDATMAQSPGIMSGFANANCLLRLNDSTYDSGSVLPMRLFKSIEC